MRHTLRYLRQYVGVARGAHAQRLFYVSWSVVSSCNFTCAGCDVWRNEYSENQVTPFDLAKVARLSRNLAKLSTLRA